MPEPIKGIHHVSAITARADKNLAFYTNTLGMRLVKKTVNQDDTSMYHLFYADEQGSPGTDLTFFEIPRAGRTHTGSQSISRTGLRLADDAAVDYWKERLEQAGVTVHDRVIESGRLTLPFEDPEGQRLALVSTEQDEVKPASVPPQHSDVPDIHAIQGLGPVELTVPKLQKSEEVLVSVLGFKRLDDDVHGHGTTAVYQAPGSSGAASEIRIVESVEPKERPGRGSVHHVAFRVRDEEDLRDWAELINSRGWANSGVVERYYFKSFYFREPNGILYELATDGPGFDIDEPLESLGRSLALPPYLEHKRGEIEQTLTPLPDQD
ncbi:ring-cleaving dioxygenase [Alkalicoccus chagannorensis]|uniref:ring-cleaving dioxygenase n=1 Tax=Alkalicoccus chagannorensis TaxID=427072 RepID=UPI00041AD713|nr:ring-cleaving dioxygenase [Alkalicoccus chagannorensis]